MIFYQTQKIATNTTNIAKHSGVSLFPYVVTEQLKEVHNKISGLDDLACRFNDNISLSRVINGGTGRYLVEFKFMIKLISHAFDQGQQAGLEDIAKNRY